MAEEELGKVALVDGLNDLIRLVSDSHEGYRYAAEGSEDDALKGLFNDLAGQRGAIVRELQRMVAEIGGAPDMGGTLVGGAHRLLLNVRQSVVGHDRDAILAEVERAEAECVRRYEETLERPVPAAVAAGLGEQLARLREDQRRLAALHGAVA